jgi:hypothetical protein
VIDESTDRTDEKDSGRVIKLKATVAAKVKVSRPTLFITANLAGAWYQDTAGVAKVTDDTSARRHEIVFAVCTVESYLLEWVRDTVLARQYQRLGDYFTEKPKRGIRERWKRVIMDLHRDKHLSAIPSFQTTVWRDFLRLVDYRDGLVHAKASLPDTSGKISLPEPVPGPSELHKLPPGWARGVVEKLIRDLHESTGTEPPAWLKES